MRLERQPKDYLGKTRDPNLEKGGRQEGCESSQYEAKGGGAERFILGGPHLSTQAC